MKKKFLKPFQPSKVIQEILSVLFYCSWKFYLVNFQIKDCSKTMSCFKTENWTVCNWSLVIQNSSQKKWSKDKAPNSKLYFISHCPGRMSSSPKEQKAFSQLQQLIHLLQAPVTLVVLYPFYILIFTPVLFIKFQFYEHFKTLCKIKCDQCILVAHKCCRKGNLQGFSRWPVSQNLQLPNRSHKPRYLINCFLLPFAAISAGCLYWTPQPESDVSISV